MTFTHYLLSALTLSLVSFIVGFGTGAWFMARRQGERPAPAALTRVQRALPAAGVALAVLIGGHYAYNVNRQQDAAKRDVERAACQSEHNVTVSRVIAIRSQLTAADARLTGASDRAQNGLLLGVAQLMAEAKPEEEQTPAQRRKENARFQKLFADFRAAAKRVDAERAANEAERVANPIPVLPEC